MVIVKRLYTFMLQRFLPLLAMTFFICLFIVLMQFLWRYIDDLVGKGLALSVIGELFFYAALTMVPTALPLAVLLASLMTFGNLGEKFELTALKAAGISLFKIMKPLIVLMVGLAIGAFFFQDYVLPVAQVKMWTLLFSMRQKSPEMEIPAKAFYDQIPKMNLYVDRKNPDTGMLYDMIIYDRSQGVSLDKVRVILADSGKLSFTEDKTHLFLRLYKGEMFEKFENGAMGRSSSHYMPFRRESFSDKELYFIFDANFNRMNDSIIAAQYVGKNIKQLNAAIDSIGQIVDSIGDNFSTTLRVQPYVHAPSYRREYLDSGKVAMIPPKLVAMPKTLNIDSIFNAPSASMAKSYVSQAIVRARQMRDNYDYQSFLLLDEAKKMRRHDIELQRKFTLSFACLIFFFIGAPLGAIIKKGGIGTPLVISVFLFIFYYIIDNTGYKLSRDGKMAVWAGIWLSSAVLLPMGVFFTYKAVGDSAVFNIDAYRDAIKRLLGLNRKRQIEYKSMVMDEVNPYTAMLMLTEWITDATEVLNAAPKRPLLDRLLGRPPLTDLEERLNRIVDYVANTQDIYVISQLNEYPLDLNYSNLKDVIQNSRAVRKLMSAKAQEPRRTDADEQWSFHRQMPGDKVPEN